MKGLARCIAVFAAGFAAALLFHYHLARDRPAAPPPVARPPSVTQFSAGGPMVVGIQSAKGSVVVVTQVDLLPLLQLRVRGFESNVLIKLQPQGTTAIVERGFLYDGLLPEDLPRTNRRERSPGE